MTKLDEVYVLYENDKKYFSSYDEAFWFRKSHNIKPIHYVFTPTMQEFTRVGELYHHARSYFNRTVGCDYYNVLSGLGHKQLQIF